MFRAIDLSRLLIIGLTLTAAPAFADDPSESELSADQMPSEVVFVSASAPELNPGLQDDLEQEVTAMVEREQMLDLIARLSTINPAS